MDPDRVPRVQDIRVRVLRAATSSRPRGSLLGIDTVALIIAVVLGAWVRPAPGTAGTPAAKSHALSVAWPSQGQASALVEGLGDTGDLGNRGTREPVPIAGITKVMTAYVILRDHPLRAGQGVPASPSTGRPQTSPSRAWNPECRCGRDSFSANGRCWNSC
ncbi:hypothetical protein M2271_003221 [Streptomyces sp. LBL]|nr:hypothetical protein [Streptomyces sp. LBL]